MTGATREENLQGNSKIIKFCEVSAQNHNITLGWIDTVCINKTSSSELDESIRSMYIIGTTMLQSASHIFQKLLIFPMPTLTLGLPWMDLAGAACTTHSVFYNKNWELMGSKQ